MIAPAYPEPFTDGELRTIEQLFPHLTDGELRDIALQLQARPTLHGRSDRKREKLIASTGHLQETTLLRSRIKRIRSMTFFGGFEPLFGTWPLSDVTHGDGRDHTEEYAEALVQAILGDQRPFDLEELLWEGGDAERTTAVWQSMQRERLEKRERLWELFEELWEHPEAPTPCHAS